MKTFAEARSRFSLPGLTIMDRYLASELVLPFLFGVAAFASIGMAIGSLFELVRLISENGLPLTTALQVFLLRMPQIITYTFPMSVLFATLLAYGRLSGDLEITALQASGVSVLRIVVPTLLLSVIVSVITFFFNEVVVPTANQEASTTLARAIGGGDRPRFIKDNILYPEYNWVPGKAGKREYALIRLFYARRYSDGIMYGLTILDYSQENLNQVITADSAYFDPKTDAWRFRNGTSYLIGNDGTYRNILQFQEQQVKISEDPLKFAQEVRRPEEMTTVELRRYIELAQNARQEIRGLLVSLYQKYAIPSVCFAFALVGAPLGLRRQRTSNALGLGLSILIIFSYYIFLFIAQALGQTGVLPPWLGAWLPALITMAVGAYLLWRANQ